MQNFIINNTSDFNMYLMKLISEENDEENDENNVCLITNESLMNNYVTMSCGHKFNYVPLINELINQKKNPNHYEITRLKSFQLKCPYCRTIQKGTIPYYSNVYEEKIKGVNWPPSRMFCNNTCGALFKSGKRKGEICGKRCVGEFCNRHNKIKSKSKMKDKNVAIKKVVRCVQILKTGKRKGLPCNAICRGEDCIKHKLCKRHKK